MCFVLLITCQFVKINGHPELLTERGRNVFWDLMKRSFKVKDAEPSSVCRKLIGAKPVLL